MMNGVMILIFLTGKFFFSRGKNFVNSSLSPIRSSSDDDYPEDNSWIVSDDDPSVVDALNRIDSFSSSSEDDY
jgi:hypothetical protein